MQEALDSFITNNVYIVLAAWWLFSNAVENMPAPADNAGQGYKWLYGFLNGLAGNMREAIGQKGFGGEK